MLVSAVSNFSTNSYNKNKINHSQNKNIHFGFIINEDYGKAMRIVKDSFNSLSFNVKDTPLSLSLRKFQMQADLVTKSITQHLKSFEMLQFTKQEQKFGELGETKISARIENGELLFEQKNKDGIILKQLNINPESGYVKTNIHSSNPKPVLMQSIHKTDNSVQGLQIIENPGTSHYNKLQVGYCTNPWFKHNEVNL